MKLSPKELTEGMRGALDKAKSTLGSVLSKSSTDEEKKKMLGSGMAASAAQNIINRKKAIDDVMGD